MSLFGPASGGQILSDNGGIGVSQDLSYLGENAHAYVELVEAPVGKLSIVVDFIASLLQLNEERRVEIAALLPQNFKLVNSLLIYWHDFPR
jgi:hypothetical protein